MCLILAAWRTDAAYPLVVAANREEYQERAAAPAAFWHDEPAILAGRDLKAMGTWMGISRNGRFAAVTNYRGAYEPSSPHSRGSLVTDFLKHGVAAISRIETQAKQYSGFNLLAADLGELWWMSNRDGAPRRLTPGIYGLGNLLLDSPEVAAPKERFRAALEPAPAVEDLFALLDESRVRNPQYGTRCSTVLLLGADGRARYAERGFAPDGEAGETRDFELSAAP